MKEDASEAQGGTVWAPQVTPGRLLLASFLIMWGGCELVLDLPAAVFHRRSRRAFAWSPYPSLTEGAHPKSTGPLARMAIYVSGICGIMAFKIAIKWIRNQQSRTKVALLYELLSYILKLLAPRATMGVGDIMLLLHSSATSSSSSTNRWIHMCALPVHQKMSNANIFFASNVPKDRTSSYLLAGDPVCGSHQRPCWKLDLKPCSKAGAAAGTGAWASQQPRALTLEVPLLCSHMYNTSIPLTQIRYYWKRCYSSEATTTIPAMTMEEERHWYPEATLCCSKNGERSASGHKARLSWPHYRYSLRTCQANNALVVRKCRCGELYLNF